MSQSAPKTHANTTNNYTSTTQIRDIGVTGAHAVSLVQTLGDITKGANGTLEKGFAFTTQMQENATRMFEKATLEAANVLKASTNATQDFSQRAIAASTGQAAPVQAIGAAGDVGGIDKTWLILGTIAAIAALYIKR